MPTSERRAPPDHDESEGASRAGLVRKRCVRQCYVAANIGGRSLETAMGNKDKGGKNSKTVAAKNLKEKRLDKKAKRTAAEAKRNRTV